MTERFNHNIIINNPDQIIQLCKTLWAEDDNGVKKEHKTTCTESGCTGRAVAFDFIKSGIVDKINALLIKEMEANRSNPAHLLKRYNKFKGLRKFRQNIEINAKYRNLPTLIQTFCDLDVVDYLYRVSFNFDEQIEKSVSCFTRSIEKYKADLHTIENEIKVHESMHDQKPDTLLSNHWQLRGYISHGTEAYKYLLQQLVCIKAYVYQGNNPFNQKRQAMSRTAEVLSHFSSGGLFLLAREIILPAIGIIARDAGHTKCAGFSIIKLVAIIEKYVKRGYFDVEFWRSDEGAMFYDLFEDAMSFIYDTANRTKNGKAAYVAVHLIEKLLNAWEKRDQCPETHQHVIQQIACYDEMTRQMVCQLYHGDPTTFRADEISVHPKLKVERANFYNMEMQDHIRYGVLFSTELPTCDPKTLQTFYGINQSQPFEALLSSRGDLFFFEQEKKPGQERRVKIRLGDIDEIIDQPFDALVICNPSNFEAFYVNEALLDAVLQPENRDRHTDFLIPEFHRKYETECSIDPQYTPAEYTIGQTVPESYYDVLMEMESRLEKNGLRILHTIDLRRILHESGGIRLPKCTILVTGRDCLLAQALAQNPLSSLILPTNIVVLEQQTGTAVFAFDPAFLSTVSDLAIPQKILTDLRERVTNIIHFQESPSRATCKNKQDKPLFSIPQSSRSLAPVSRTYPGVDMNRVLDKLLYVSKAARHGNELSQLGVLNLFKNGHNGANGPSNIVVALVGKLETVAEDVKKDPSVLSFWPYRLLVRTDDNDNTTHVAAIDPVFLGNLTNRSTFRSFGKDTSRRIHATINDTENELAPYIELPAHYMGLRN